MLKVCLPAFLLVGFFSFINCVADAQEVVHAVSGVVTSINPAKKTIDIHTVDGSQDFFKDLANSATSLDFDKVIRENSTPADGFTKVGANVIVFYFGEGLQQTAVALRDLGKGPLQRDTGTIAGFNRHDHLLTIKDSTGNSVSFHVGPKTVVESAFGAVDGSRFNAEKGEQVRVTAGLANGQEDALFIRAQ
jgi:hypothetical protein